ncbi:MAG: hypothetical protein ACPH3I_05270 [Porticoccaceae bacterium]
MSTNESVTEEELRALMPFYEIEESRFRQIKKRIVIRTSIVGFLMTLRGIVVYSFPELLNQTDSQGNVLDSYISANVLLVRTVLLAVTASVYVYCLWTNKYFRTMSVIALIVAYSLVWADLETYVFTITGEMSIMMVILLLLRMCALGLLFANYLDIRR